MKLLSRCVRSNQRIRTTSSRIPGSKALNENSKEAQHPKISTPIAQFVPTLQSSIPPITQPNADNQPSYTTEHSQPPPEPQQPIIAILQTAPRALQSQKRKKKKKVTAILPGRPPGSEKSLQIRPSELAGVRYPRGVRSRL